jgi:4-amino-4-deoxy-L-arabinose transferase-like glycosyltransferase
VTGDVASSPSPDPARRLQIGLWVLLLGSCGILFLASTDRPGLLEKDEPRYSITARNMARTGDWLVPRYNGRERLVKPPGTYWAIASSFRATGSFSERSARLPSGIAAILTVLLVAWGVARASGPGVGRVAGWILATTLLFFGEGRLATTDMLFTLLFTGAAAALVPVLEGDPRTWRWMLLSGALGGAAFLVKTPLALLLPPIAAGLAAWLRARRSGADSLPPTLRGRALLGTTACWAAGLALGVGLFAAWYYPANAATEGRLAAQFGSEVAARMDSDEVVHGQPPWFYVTILPAALLPWTFLLPAGICASWKRAAEPGRAGTLCAYALCLAAVVLLFFSALPSKLWSYVLPLVPAVAVLLVEGLLSALVGLPSPAARLFRWVGGIGTLAVAAAISVSPHVTAVRDGVGREALDEADVALAALAGLLGLAAILALARRPGGFVAAAGLATCSLMFTAGPVLPYVEDARCGRDLAGALRQAGMREEDRLFDATNHITGVLWYADRTSETKPDGTAPEEKWIVDAFSAGERTFAILYHEPGGAGEGGKRTQWERIRDRLAAGARPPRVLWHGRGRVAVTNVSR